MYIIHNTYILVVHIVNGNVFFSINSRPIIFCFNWSFGDANTDYFTKCLRCTKYAHIYWCNIISVIIKMIQKNKLYYNVGVHN